MGTIAAGVLPVADVANKSLALVAEAIMPKPIYIFFIVGGAMFALLTTLNASIGWMCRPIVQAAKDGWYPDFVAKTNKHGAPYVVLTVIMLYLDVRKYAKDHDAESGVHWKEIAVRLCLCGDRGVCGFV